MSEKRLRRRRRNVQRATVEKGKERKKKRMIVSFASSPNYSPSTTVSSPTTPTASEPFFTASSAYSTWNLRSFLFEESLKDVFFFEFFFEPSRRADRRSHQKDEKKQMPLSCSFFFFSRNRADIDVFRLCLFVKETSCTSRSLAFQKRASRKEKEQRKGRREKTFFFHARSSRCLFLSLFFSFLFLSLAFSLNPLTSARRERRR